jgi:hypothetical protein
MNSARFYMKRSDGAITPLVDAIVDDDAARILAYLDGRDIDDAVKHLPLEKRNVVNKSLYARLQELVLCLLPERPCRDVARAVRFSPGGTLPIGAYHYVVSCDYILGARGDGVECVTGAKLTAAAITDAELALLRQVLP